jgi:hypothetical protein
MPLAALPGSSGKTHRAECRAPIAVRAHDLERGLDRGLVRHKARDLLLTAANGVADLVQLDAKSLDGELVFHLRISGARDSPQGLYLTMVAAAGALPLIALVAVAT